ncbi:MAG: HAD-IIIC family phosphatase [Selenomonadaceae bacterium]|nr:HAD-IIIC family phosphatase [Selenomonadaceae bacterium]
MKVALLSNINADPINRYLNGCKDIEIYEPQGYGNELGVLLNRDSSLYDFAPDMVFIITDLMELIGRDLEITAAGKKIDEWFALFESSLSEGTVFYVSDAFVHGFEVDLVWERNVITAVENKWDENLYALANKYSNVRVFGLNRIIRLYGESNAFSRKMWYMGKILYSVVLQKALAEEIIHRTKVEIRQPKKALLLDLDNTLWRGLAGENDIAPVILSEDGVGLAYKNFQRGIKLLKSQGVILGIVSKNNEADAISIIENHPHMVLRLEDFATYRINWENKAENIVSISKELNIGLDSIVFIDDNKAEQALIREALSQVYVPDFPVNPEELSSFIAEIYRQCFEKPIVTDEDKNKTKQYRENQTRKQLMKASVDFAGYLDNLEMRMVRVNPEKHKERLLQLVNKTNQFNLTTKRLTEQELADILCDNHSEVFLYRVLDRFGDNGIVAAAMVEYRNEAVITEFTMSCRVMGRKIEDAVIDDIEKYSASRGYGELVGIYIPTEKNKPVRDLYSSLGYKKRKVCDDGTFEFVISLKDDLVRDIHVERTTEV